MENEQAADGSPVTPQLGATGYFCMELFCGSGNLTFAMKHFFPDSFGVDHKVGKQRVKVICLDLTREDHQELVTQWAMSGQCLWVHFGIPCGTASMARYKRLSKKIHGPPPLRSSRWPDGLPNVTGTNLLRLRAANRLYAFMSKLIIQLESSNITWTVENPWTSLLWVTSYWKKVDSQVHAFYAELHNCMFGGQRMKRTCIASNNEAVMSLNVLCDGNHEHAPWSMQDGIFDTAREAEYTPALAKALATVILESIAKVYKLPNVMQSSKKLKLSHFQSIAAGKQPSKALAINTVPEFAFILVLNNVPASVSIPMADDCTVLCLNLCSSGHNFLLPCHCKMLRRTKKMGEPRPFRYVLERPPALTSLSDVQVGNVQHADVYPTLKCPRADCCHDIREVLIEDFTDEEHFDMVFGVRWTPEEFLQHAIRVGHPFKNFSGLSNEVKTACEHLATASYEQVVTERCHKLGEWIQAVRRLQDDETRIKDGMPDARRRILDSKRVAFMRYVIEAEGYDDRSLADDLERGFDLVGDTPKSSVLPAKLVPATISQQDLGKHASKANKALRYMTRSCGNDSLDKQLWDKKRG